jgi:hypothetical protein
MLGLWAWLNLDFFDIVAFAISNLIGFGIGLLIPDHTIGIYVSILVSYHLFLFWLANSGDRKFGLSMPLPATIFTHLACAFLVVCLALARAYIPFFGLFRYAIVAMALFERNWLFSVADGPVVDDGPIDLLKSRMDRGLYQPPPPSTPILAAPFAASSTLAAQSSAIPTYQPLVNLSQPVVEADLPRAAPVKAETAIAQSVRRKPTVEAAKVTPILNATAQDHEDWLRERASQNPAHRKLGMTVRQEYEEWLKARYRNRAPQNGARTKA